MFDKMKELEERKAMSVEDQADSFVKASRALVDYTKEQKEEFRRLVGLRLGSDGIKALEEIGVKL